MSSNFELLKFRNIELIFSDQSRDRASLEDRAIDESDYVHACDKVLA